MKSRLSERHVIKKSDNAAFFVEDILVRNFVEKFYPRSGIAKIIIRKTAKDGEIIIFTSKTGILMGKDGAKLKECESLLKKKFSKEFKITLKTTKIPELSSKIMAEHIATQLESYGSSY
jgi:small subunit ribosomal protein S3